MRAAGFAEPSWIDKMKEANKLNKKDTRYQQYMEQDDLNIEITAVCDIFDVYGEAAVLTGSNIHREVAAVSSGLLRNVTGLIKSW